MAEVKRPRRYYLHKRLEALRACDHADGVWRAKQEAEPGTALPDGFPSRTELAAYGYETREDLDGADEAELQKLNLTAKQAQAVLAALAALP